MTPSEVRHGHLRCLFKQKQTTRATTIRLRTGTAAPTPALNAVVLVILDGEDCAEEVGAVPLVVVLWVAVVVPVDDGTVRGVVDSDVVEFACAVAATRVVFTTKLVIIVGLALPKETLASENDGIAMVEAIAFTPIIVCGKPGGSEKVPFPVPQLHLSRATSGSQHHVSWPHETKDPLLALTGLPRKPLATWTASTALEDDPGT
ncbi:hypothetical protein MMC30_000280 [Trapelia coarctata]|nr:hypothetical protein [Trapelia coarctata]